jgi:hypothetical protein
MWGKCVYFGKRESAALSFLLRGQLPKNLLLNETWAGLPSAPPRPCATARAFASRNSNILCSGTL